MRERAAVARPRRLAAKAAPMARMPAPAASAMTGSGIDAPLPLPPDPPGAAAARGSAAAGAAPIESVTAMASVSTASARFALPRARLAALPRHAPVPPRAAGGDAGGAVPRVGAPWPAPSPCSRLRAGPRAAPRWARSAPAAYRCACRCAYRCVSTCASASGGPTAATEWPRRARDSTARRPVRETGRPRWRLPAQAARGR